MANSILDGGGAKLPLLRAGAVAMAVAATGLGYWLTVAKGRLGRRQQRALTTPPLEPQVPVLLGGEDG